jgi:hypothetical protein
MKIGDLVRLNSKVRWLTEEQHKATGIILQILDGGSHRKNTSYQVMWSTKLRDTMGSASNIGWHTSRCIVEVK